MVGSLVTAAVAWVILSENENDTKDTNDDDNDSPDWWGAKWRLFAALCALSPATAAWTCWHWAPESPRFLVAQGRTQDAEVALESLLTAYGPPSPPAPPPPLVRLEARNRSSNVDSEPCSNSTVSASLLPGKPDREAINPAGESIGTVGGSSLERAPDNSSSSVSSSSSSGCTVDALHLLEQWRALVIDRRNRRPFLALCGVWVALSFGYYGLATWITVLFDACGLTNVYASAFLYCAAQLPGNLAVFITVDRVGRRPLLLASMLSAAASALLFAWVSDPTSTKSNQVASSRVALVVVAAMMFNAACTAAWDVVNVAR